MEDSGDIQGSNKNQYDVKTFTIQNSNRKENNDLNLSKEKLIKEGLNLHSKGNIDEAVKYYQYFLEKGFTDPRILSNYATICTQKGDLNKAFTLYKRSIQLFPKSSLSFNNLGKLLKDTGKIKEAEMYVRKAIEIRSDYFKAFNNLGTILIAKGERKEAESIFRRAIKLKPNYAEAQSNLGSTLKDLGRLEEAESITREAIKNNPDLVEANLNLGIILKDLGQLEEAESITRELIKSNPDLVEANSNLGIILKDLGQLEEAVSITRKVIELRPNYAEAQANLGSILIDLGRLEEAESITREAIKNNPDLVEAYLNLGLILKGLGQLKEAESITRELIKNNPDLVEAYLNLGVILKDLGQLEDAETITCKAIELRPNYAKAHAYFGSILFSLKKFDLSRLEFEKSLDLGFKSESTKGLFLYNLAINCDWKYLRNNNHLFNNLGLQKQSVNPSYFWYLEDDPQKDLKRAKKYYKENFLVKTLDIKPKKNKKIKIGYFTSNFCSHSSMVLLCRVIELHNKDKFEVFAYDFGKHDSDEYTERVKKSVDIFRYINNLSDIDIVNLAKNDNLDIAIDLMGYTENNRARIFSHRVAPIQIEHLDYPGTTGNDSIDYLIADRTLIRPEEEINYTEKIIRMPHARQPLDDTLLQSNNIFRRSDFGLNENAFVFCCFSNSHKIQYKEFKIWMNLLSRVDNSCLWLKESNPISKSNLLIAAEDLGIENNRLIFSKKISIRDHMSRQSCADLALDTFNFSSGVMTQLALKTGLPLITMPGNTMASRLATSILNELGLNELICENLNSYEEKAYYIATNKKYLLLLKEKILNLQKTSPYFSSSKYCSDLEAIYMKLINN